MHVAKWTPESYIKMSNAVGFEELQSVLDEAMGAVAAGEIHGEICGILFSNGLNGAPVWLSEIMRDSDGNAGAAAECERVLRQLIDQVRANLNGLLLEFAPLLPDDDVQLDTRAHVLGLWCQGYLRGLLQPLPGAHGGRSLREDADVAEIIDDLAEISRATHDNEQDSQLGEQSFAELEQYVRVGAQLIFEALHQSASGSGQIQATLH